MIVSLAEGFQCDTFLSHGVKDRAIVSPLAEGSLSDALKVWLDKWMLKPKATKAAREKITDGRLTCAHAFC